MEWRPVNRLPSFSILWLLDVKCLRIMDAHSLGTNPGQDGRKVPQSGKLVPPRRPGVRGLALFHPPAPSGGPLAGREAWGLTAPSALSL